MRLLLFNLATDADDPILGFTTRWIGALSQKVEFVYVITMRQGHIEMADNVRVYSVGKEKGYTEPRRAVEFYRLLFRILRDDHIDVCFSHMIPIFTVMAAPVLRPRGIPIITWIIHPRLSWIMRLAHHLSDRIVTSTATSYPYRHDKLTVVGHGIDTNLFSPDGRVPLEDPLIVLCAGRLSSVKDHPTLLKATWLLRQHWSGAFRVVILGGPATPRDEYYARSLCEQVKQLGLEDTIQFEPAVSMVNLPSWYRRCAVHINLTRTGSADKVAWEAMACGRPCLVANEGFKETLGDYADRLLFCYRNPEDLANKLVRLLTLPKTDRDRLGLYLRRQVEQKHSLDRLAGKLIGVFQSMKEC
jgi:glycosyltransferase involved in cell wall biosynthesis